MASKMWAHSPQKWYFFGINLSLRENHGVNRKLEYRCTTINLPLWNDTLIVLKITLFHSVSVITNFVIPKRDRHTDNYRQKNHTFSSTAGAGARPTIPTIVGMVIKEVSAIFAPQ